MATDPVIISRQQQRRGLKQNLPQPLRTGEIGFATDSRQVYIGSDTNDITSALYNKSTIFETVINAIDTTLSIANTNLIFFGVPFKSYPAASFDGVTTVASWNLDDLQFASGSLEVFNPEITALGAGVISANTSSSIYVVLNAANTYISSGDVVSGTGIVGAPTVTNVNGTNITLSAAQTLTSADTLTFTPDNILNLRTNETFNAEDLTVCINGLRQDGDRGNVSPASDKDYSFSASTLGSNTHSLTFRVAPLTTDEVDIAYYDKNAMTQALSRSNAIFSGSNTRSFYAEQSIPSYRQLANSLVSVSYTTGTGIIGLEFKHLAVTAEGTVITTPGNVTLGNLLVSRDSQQGTGANITYATDQLTVDVGSGHAYDAVDFDYIFIEDAGTQWVTDKVLPIDTFNATNVVVTIPTANAYQTSRKVTAAAAIANVVTVTGNVEGLTASNYVVFRGANAFYFNDGAAYQVLSVSTTSFTVNERNVSVPLASGLNFINYGIDNTGANVQIFSENHGNPLGADVEIISSSDVGDIATGTKTIIESVTDNTYIIAATSAVTANVKGTSNVVVDDSGTVSHTQVRSIDLSASTTVTEALAVVDAITDWPQLSLVPNTTDFVYFTHKPAYDSVGVDFHIFEDSVGTLDRLGLAARSYTKSKNTVKAKLERWLNNLVTDKTLNLLTEVKATTKYSSYGISDIGTYTANLDTVNNELIFNSREEARDFSFTVNRIYHERAGSSVRGLINLKTNVEMLTVESVVTSASAATSTYGAPNELTVPIGTSTLPSLINADADEYNVHIIDYSLIDTSITANINYMRVGTMHVGAHDSAYAGNVALLDLASETLDSRVSGDVEFTAAISANNTITVSSVNTLNGGGVECTMRFITRRWLSD